MDFLAEGIYQLSLLLFQIETIKHIVAQKIKSLRADKKMYVSLNDKLNQQQTILQEEVEIEHQNYSKASTLYEKNLISQTSLTEAKSTYLDKQYALKEAESNIIKNGLQISDTQSKIIALQQKFREQSRKLVLAVQESYKKLASDLATWEQNYILIAPTDGHVSFYKFWSDNH